MYVFSDRIRSILYLSCSTFHGIRDCKRNPEKLTSYVKAALVNPVLGAALTHICCPAVHVTRAANPNEASDIGL